MEAVHLGLLVRGAARVEEEVGRLSHSARRFTGRTRTRAYTALRPTLARVRNSFQSYQFKPIMRRVEPLSDEIEHETKVFLGRAEYRAGLALTGFVDKTIIELEKVRQELEQRFPERWNAA
jgi:hypothetical protein